MADAAGDLTSGNPPGGARQLARLEALLAISAGAEGVSGTRQVDTTPVAAQATGVGSRRSIGSGRIGNRRSQDCEEQSQMVA